MSNRFEKTKDKFIPKLVRFLPLIALIVIFVAFIFGVNSIGDTTNEKRLDSLKTAIDRSISQCYSLEGAYPESIEYLAEHYGLIIDENVFYVDYDYYGSNLYPEVHVLMKGNPKLKAK